MLWAEATSSPRRAPPRGSTGIKSVRRSRPASVVKTVASTFVSPAYDLDAAHAPAGPTLNQPPFFASSRRQKAAGLSKWGRQHQSIEPSVATSAAVCASPTSA
jgi:hypothetical protein